MLTPPHILFCFGLIAWGTAYIGLSADIHHATARLAALEPFSAAAFAREQLIERVTIVGVLVGLAVFGHLADRLGRFRVALWCMALTPVLFALAALAGSGIDFAALRFLMGATVGGLLLSTTILVFEAKTSDSFRLSLVLLVVFFWILLGCWAFVSAEMTGTDLSWRVHLGFSALPPLVLSALAVLLGCLYHDETKAWKRAVRDKKHVPDHRPHGFTQLFKACRRKRFLYAVVLAMFLFGGIYGVTTIGSELVRQSVRFALAQASGHDEQCEDAALIVYLLRYPQLLATKEIDAVDFTVVSEKFHPTASALPADLFEGLMRLHEQGKPINRESVIDQALGIRNERLAPGRQPGAIPLPEIRYFAAEVRFFLSAGEQILNEKPSFQDDVAGPTSGVERWDERKTFLKTLLAELQERLESRQRDESLMMRLFRMMFLCGGVLGLACQFYVARYFKPKTVLFLFGVASLFVSLGLLCFNPTLEITELRLLKVYMPILGGCVIPLFANGCMMLPRRFPVSVRATGTGTAAALGGMVGLLLF